MTVTMKALHYAVLAQNIARIGENAVYCTFLIEIFYPLCIYESTWTLSAVHCYSVTYY